MQLLQISTTSTNCLFGRIEETDSLFLRVTLLGLNNDNKREVLKSLLPYKKIIFMQDTIWNGKPVEFSKVRYDTSHSIHHVNNVTESVLKFFNKAILALMTLFCEELQWSNRLLIIAFATRTGIDTDEFMNKLQILEMLVTGYMIIA